MRPDLPWRRGIRRLLPGPRTGHLVPLTLAGVLVAGLALAVVGLRDDDGQTSDTFGARVPGQRIYDQAGLLSVAEIAALDARAAAIEGGGVPVVVYIRRPASTTADTEQDAAALMDSWSVESAPGADDGIVLLLDVDEGDVEVDPGDVVLVAGDRLKQSRLPDAETERIAAAVPPVVGAGSRDALAAGIGTGLAAAQLRLLIGAPASPGPSLAERFVTGVVRVPLAVLSLLLVVATLAVVAITWHRRPRPAACAAEPPGSLALRAALRGNQVGPEAVAGGVRDLAHAGAVSYRDGPDDGTDETVAIHLVARDRAPDALTRALWDDLAAVADRDDVVPVARLGALGHHDGAFQRQVEIELERRGLWDVGADRRARPLSRLGRGLAVLGAMSLVLVVAVGEPVGVPSAGSLLVAASVAWATARAYPRATALGLATRREVVTGGQSGGG